MRTLLFLLAATAAAQSIPESTRMPFQVRVPGPGGGLHGSAAQPTDTNSGGGCTGSSPSWTCTTTPVTITLSAGSAVICYRTDGTNPAATSPGTCDAGSTTYSGTFTISATTTVKALGTKVGLTNSSILSSVYTISGGAPSGFTATSGNVNQAGSFTFPLPSLNVTSGQALIVAFGIHAGSTQLCQEVTGVSGTGGDTFTNVGNASVAPNATCVSVWAVWSPTPNASYVVTLQGNSSAPANYVYGVLQFTKNSIAGTADTTCSATSAGATALQCSSNLSPTGSIELGYWASFGYDNLSGSEADSSTPSFTIPTNGKFGNTTGSIVFAYYIGNPPAGTLTPKVTGQGLGDPLVIYGEAFK